MPGQLRTLDEIIEVYKRDCNHYVNGRCAVNACMERNWVVELGKPNCYVFVGCLSYQTIKFLEGVKAALT